jgi:GNAT superfamily N-acetyltransferase
MRDPQRVTVRYYDPETDDPAEVARCNPFPPEVQAMLAEEYRQHLFAPQNLIVAVAEGHVVGVLHLFDAGFPWAFLDGWYVQPAYRSYALARAMGRFAEQELRRRGIRTYLYYAPEPLATATEYAGCHRLGGTYTLMGGRLTAQE